MKELFDLNSNNGYAVLFRGDIKSPTTTTQIYFPSKDSLQNYFDELKKANLLKWFEFGKEENSVLKVSYMLPKDNAAYTVNCFSVCKCIV